MPTSRLNEDDPTFGEINLLLRTLRALDERGLILVLGAFAEESLAELLKVYMRPGASKPLLEGFNAPLGTLSARIGAVTCH